MNAPLRYVDELIRAQGAIEQTISAVERRLVDSRMARLAPLPKVETGFHGLDTPRFNPVPGRTELPLLPEPPADLQEAVQAVVRDIHARIESGVAATQPTAQQADLSNQTRVLESDRDAMSRKTKVTAEDGDIRSLIHDTVVVGNRREIDLIASTRMHLDVDGTPGIRGLFPDFESRGAVSFAIDVSLHRIGPVSDGEESDLDLGPIIPGMVQTGWRHRALPWTRNIRNFLLSSFGLPTAFVNAPANVGDDRRDRRLATGDAFVILAIDPDSAEYPATSPLADLTSSDEKDSSRHREDARDETTPDKASDSAAQQTGQNLSALLKTAYERFVQTVLEDGDAGFPAFLETIRKFESDEGAGLESWSREFLERFAAWCDGQTESAPKPLSTQEIEQQKPRPSGETAAPEILLSFAIDRQQLIRKFKHAPDFGVTDHFGPVSLERYAQALEQHLQAASGRHVATLRGVEMIAHIEIGRIVWTTEQGEFVTGYKASPEQLQHIWTKPTWRER